MAGLYSGLTLGFSSALRRPWSSSRSLLVNNVLFKSLTTVRRYSTNPGSNGAPPPLIGVPLRGVFAQREALFRRVPYTQRAAFASAPEFPSKPQPAVKLQKSRLRETVSDRRKERNKQYWQRRKQQGQETLAERIARKSRAAARKATTRRRTIIGVKEKKVFGRRKTWSWRWLRRRISRVPPQFKSRLLPWHRRRSDSWIRMRDAFHRKFFPIVRRKARKPVSISTLDPDKLQQSDYITLPWSGSCWVTTDIPLPKRYIRNNKLGKVDNFLEDSSEPVEPHRQWSDNGTAKTKVASTENSESATEEDYVNPATYSYRRWDIPRFVQELNYPADATDPESLRHVPFPPRRPRPKYEPRKWSHPRFVRGRAETRKFRRYSRIANKRFRREVLGIKKRPLFYWYKFSYPPSLFEPRGGFLYLYKPPPGLPETAVGLRFRITNDRDPKSFVFGRDLTYQGVPWTIPLHYGPIRNPIIRHLIFKDNLVVPSVMDRCGELRRKLLGEMTVQSKRYKLYRKLVQEGKMPDHMHPYELHRDTSPRIPFIYALGQPFRIDLSVPSMRICILGTKGDTDNFYQFRLGLPKWQSGVDKKPKRLREWEAEQAKLEIKRARSREKRRAARARKKASSGAAESLPEIDEPDDSSPQPVGLMDWQDYDRVFASKPASEEHRQPSKTDARAHQPGVRVPLGGVNASIQKHDEPTAKQGARKPTRGIPPDSKPNLRYRPIYSGSVIACFETRTLEAPVDSEVVVLRILRVIDRVEPVAGIWPAKPVPNIRNGSLLPYLDPHTLSGGPWYWPQRKRPRNKLMNTLLSLPQHPSDTSV